MYQLYFDFCSAVLSQTAFVYSMSGLIKYLLIVSEDFCQDFISVYA